MTDEAKLRADLEAALQRERGDPSVHVQSLVRLSGGASRSTWSFDLTDASNRTLGCILQRQLPGGTMGGPGMTGEAALLGAAAAAGVAVAPLVCAGDADAGLGEPFLVTERIEGETIPRRLLRDDRYAAARERLAGQCGAALAGIHTLDPAAVPGLDGSDRLDRYRQVLDLLGDAHPTFELAFRWLQEHRPAAVAPTVVHGDFRLGNLLVDETGLRAVLDWELAHVGDPMEDLGWLCVRSWRFGGPGRVGGFGQPADLFAAYEAAGGRPIDPAVVHWWEVMGTLGWGIICIVQSRRHLDGHTRSVELASIGRRVAETEYDLLGLLGAAPPGTDDSSTSDTTDTDPGAEPTLHDRPTSAELVGAVRGYLEADVLAHAEGSARFQARVAVNALAIVERELLGGPGPARAHAARLAGFDSASDADLAAKIRSGDLDARPDLADALLASVIDKLQVANPRWLAGPHSAG